MMSRPVEWHGGNSTRALDKRFPLSGVKNSDQYVTGLVACEMLAALGVRFAFVWGLLAFALKPYSYY